MGRSVLGTAVGTVALAVAGTAIALALAEGVTRVWGPSFAVVFRESVQPSENPVLEYELRPGARDGALRISPQGLRDDAAANPKPAGIFRVVAAGDSITFGSGGPRERGWVEHLEALLAARTGGAPPRFEVWNLGVPGYNATQVIERLRTAGLPLEPDAIVYAYVLNDPQSFSLEAAALRRMRAEAEERAAGDREAGLMTRWLARSRLLLWIRHGLASGDVAPRGPARMPEEPAYRAEARGERAGYFRALHADPASWRRVEEALDELAALAVAARAPALVAIFPLFPDGPDDDPLADVHARVAAAARARRLAVVDLAPVYVEARRRLRERLHLDFLHPNALGNRLAAHAVLAGLCAARALPRAPELCTTRAGAGLDGELARLVASALGAPPEG